MKTSIQKLTKLGIQSLGILALLVCQNVGASQVWSGKGMITSLTMHASGRYVNIGFSLPVKKGSCENGQFYTLPMPEPAHSRPFSLISTAFATDQEIAFAIEGCAGTKNPKILQIQVIK